MNKDYTRDLREEIANLNLPRPQLKKLLRHIQKIDKSLNRLEFQYRRTHAEKSAITSLLTQVSEDLTHQHEESERKSQELAIKNEKLKEAREAADQASQIKSQFLANMSHEIRTPMNGVLGMLQLLELSYLNAEQQKYVETIRTGGESLLSIINEILDFSKIEAGKVELDECQFQVRSFAHTVVDLLRPNADKKGLRLQLDIEPDIPNALIGDVGRIRQVLINLIGNAIKFTQKGHVHIDISAIYVTGSECQLYIQVHDTGIGIPGDKIARLFEPFTQEDASTTRKYGGTGLGLAISMGLIKLMGGDIGVRSKPNKGTSFFCFLPLTIPSSDMHECSNDRSKEQEQGASISGFSQHLPLNILVAEDNPMNQIVAESVFEQMGYQVQIVEDGEQAVHAVMQESFDIVFMDLQMPVMDGATASKRIREHFKKEKEPVIIAMTANAFEESQELCFRSGMNDFISKPYKLSDLQALLLKWGQPVHEPFIRV